MSQKIIKVGSSAAVTMSKKSLGDMRVQIGDSVDVKTNEKTQMTTIVPVKKVSMEDNKIAKLTLNFINRYRSDLEALAKK